MTCLFLQVEWEFSLPTWWPCALETPQNKWLQILLGQTPCSSPQHPLVPRTVLGSQSTQFIGDEKGMNREVWDREPCRAQQSGPKRIRPVQDLYRLEESVQGYPMQNREDFKKKKKPSRLKNTSFPTGPSTHIAQSGVPVTTPLAQQFWQGLRTYLQLPIHSDIQRSHNQKPHEPHLTGFHYGIPPHQPF